MARIMMPKRFFSEVVMMVFLCDGPETEKTKEKVLVIMNVLLLAEEELAVVV